MNGRTPCLNPRCRRTAPAADFPDEMICGKCFRAVPAELRDQHRRCWREYRKWSRRIARTSDQLKRGRKHDIHNRWAALIDLNWERIRGAVMAPDKPAGLETFLQEAGLA